MSYLALARKWRPTQFNEVVGQAHVLTALENALAQNRLHHAYLFSGTRGVGKTTIGRLFAKGLNCETGITATPCGECSTCKEIDEGRFVDLLEIDAASRTKVEDTRELLDNVQYKPARGRFKVYLIDEVHMLSRHSFNALLKTLEEPPEYVKFLLATTDPQKLPVTILSRCLQFHLKPISVDTIHQQLDKVLAAESVEAEARALGMISHAADGSMRDALSLTDQAIALGNGKVLTDSVAHMLGTLDTDQAIHVLEAISAKQAQVVMGCVEKLASNGVEWDGLLQQLASQLHRIAMYQALPSTLDQGQPDSEKIELLSRALSPEDVQLYYQIALKGRADLTASPSERMGIEMILLRMLAFRPVKSMAVNVISTEPSQAVAAPVSTPSSANVVNQAQASAVERPNQPAPAPSAALDRVDEPSYSSESLTPESPAYEQPLSAPPAYGYEDSMGYSELPPGFDTSSIEPPANYDVPSEPMMGQAPTPAPEQAQPQPEPAPKASSPVSGLRHQLRSQRKGLSGSSNAASGQNKGNSPKKASAASAKKESVLDRVAQKHQGSERVSPLSSHSHTQETAEKDNEPYQWKPSKPIVKEKSTELTPTQIKRALEHIKTPEMAQKLVEESNAQDEWAALISKLSTAKLVEQLALNSAYTKDGSTIALTLRNSQAHLNTDKAQSELLAALNSELGEECQLTVEIGESGTTPLELRDTLYQGKLQQAYDSLEKDSHVKFFEQRFAAELDRDSVRPI